MSECSTTQQKLANQPETDVPALWRDGFRPFFILLPVYIILSMLLWAAFWGGLLSVEFQPDILSWHIYEMMFGVASAGMAGFILTLVPEFFEETATISPLMLKVVVAVWVAGRIAFWLIGWLGVIPVALINLALLVMVVGLICKPVIKDPHYRHHSLLLIFVAITVLQALFFAVHMGIVNINAMALLKSSLGAFMVLELLALRRITMGICNTVIEDAGWDETFFAKPPAYNVAIACVILYSCVEFFYPNNPVLGWLGLAAAAAILNITNDFWLERFNLLKLPMMAPLLSILLLMAFGYGLMGIDHLVNSFYGLNHLRHFLTTGVLGMSFFLVMVIVGTVHTGRPIQHDVWVYVGVVLILAATLIRAMITWFPAYSTWFYSLSSLIWALPFAIYLIRFLRILSSPAVLLPGQQARC